MVTLGPIEGLGTQWWFELFDCEAARADSVRARLTERIERFNNDYSRFRSDSYIGRLNNGQAISNPPAELLELLQLGLVWYDRTNGHFNFLSGHLQDAQGYDAEYSFETTKQLLPALNPHEQLMCTAETVELAAGKLDFGGFGKGFLIDQLATLVREEFKLQRFLINGGGDMYGASDTEPIEVYIEHPTKPKMFIAKVPLQNQALAVSSSYKRQWHDKTSRVIKNHFIDVTDSDRLVEGSSRYIVATTAVVADTLATVASVAPIHVTEPLLVSDADAFALWTADDKFYCSQPFKQFLLFQT